MNLLLLPLLLLEWIAASRFWALAAAAADTVHMGVNAHAVAGQHESFAGKFGTSFCFGEKQMLYASS